jgi:hypothetical protein
MIFELRKNPTDVKYSDRIPLQYNERIMPNESEKLYWKKAKTMTKLYRA